MLRQLIYNENQDPYTAIVNCTQLDNATPNDLIYQEGLLRKILIARESPPKIALHKHALFFITTTVKEMELYSRPSTAYYRLHFLHPDFHAAVEEWEQFFIEIRDWERTYLVKNVVQFGVVFACLLQIAASGTYTNMSKEYECLHDFGPLLCQLVMLSCMCLLTFMGASSQKFTRTLYHMLAHDVGYDFNGEAGSPTHGDFSSTH